MVRRVVDADVAADRPSVPDLHVANRGGHLREDGPGDIDLGGVDDLCQRRHRAQLEPSVAAEADLV